MANVAFFVPKRCHSELIGKGGSVVQGLQSSHNVTIRIPSRDDSSSQINVLGSTSDVEQVRTEMERILGFKIGTEPLVSVQFEISPSHYGAIIGKGGQTLKDLQVKHGVSIDIPKKETNSNLVTVEGTKSAVSALKSDVEKIIGGPIKLSGSVQAQQVTTAKKLDLVSRAINEVLFFPDADRAVAPHFERFLAFLSSANKTRDICVFTITDDRISQVILDAHRSGVRVRIITDEECTTQVGSDIARLKAAGITILTNKVSHSVHMHHKFAVLDGALLINGSFNWTRQASLENSENVMFTNLKDFVSSFSKHFESLWNDRVYFKPF